MRLGIDLDGVVADFSAGWMRLHAEESGSELRPDMVETWNSLHRQGGFDDMREFWSWAGRSVEIGDAENDVVDAGGPR